MKRILLPLLALTITNAYAEVSRKPLADKSYCIITPTTITKSCTIKISGLKDEVMKTKVYLHKALSEYNDKITANNENHNIAKNDGILEELDYINTNYEESDFVTATPPIYKFSTDGETPTRLIISKGIPKEIINQEIYGRFIVTKNNTEQSFPFFYQSNINQKFEVKSATLKKISKDQAILTITNIGSGVLPLVKIIINGVDTSFNYNVMPNSIAHLTINDSEIIKFIETKVGSEFTFREKKNYDKITFTITK